MLLFGILIIGCENKTSRELKKNEVQRYIDELDSILNMLNAREHSLPPDSFFTVYSNIRALYEVIPDTSHHKINSYFKVCDELHNNGAYHEAIRLGLHGISTGSHPQLPNNGESNKQGLYGLTAGCYIRLGQLDSSLIMYQTAIKQSLHIPDRIAQSSAVNNLGIFLLRHKNQYDSALRCFQLSDSILGLHDLNDSRARGFQGTIKHNMAYVYEKTGDYRKARQIYEDNYKFFDEVKNSGAITITGIYLANTMLETGNENEALMLLDEMKGMLDTVPIAQKMRHEIQLASIYNKYYERTGNYAQALVYADREIQLSDSLRTLDDIKMSNTMAHLADINSAQFSLKISLEKQAANALQKVNRLRFWVIFAIMISGMGALTTLFVLYRQRSILLKKNASILEDKRILAEKQLKAEAQEKKLTELELKSKQKDLVQMAMHLTQKQEWARYLNTLLERIENTKGYQRQKELSLLKSEIRNQLYVDNEIELLQQNVAQLNAAFYDKLVERFPNLSKTEKRMCSYIRLDLSTHQIAQLQNIDPSSVKVRRYRLKKKLNLSQDEDLDDFLRKL